MRRDLFVETERFPIAGGFAISRGTKTHAEVVTCTLVQDGKTGRGECVPYGRYGETIESVMAAIESMRQALADGISRQELLTAMPAGAARNAVDCALWDLDAKREKLDIAQELGAGAPRALETAYTISLGEPDAMAAQAARNAGRPLLKVKVGTADDTSRIEAVAAAAPDSRIILDANEGWTADNIRHHMLVSARCRIALVEQPLPAGDDAILADIPHPVPVCADESVHGTADLDKLLGLYDAVNIKLDKTGGLTEAIQLHGRARQLGFGIMVGCMVGTSLAMAPALWLAQDAEFVDLDGPLLLEKDREPALAYEGSMVSPPVRKLWG
ncbi:MAG: N-acetyl-D-Glu racemase DgcA [Rhizobiaceae bacterium]